jgi:hypothetical protein
LKNTVPISCILSSLILSVIASSHNLVLSAYGQVPPETVLKCYIISTSSNNIDPENVTLQDQFRTFTIDLSPAQRVCEEGLKHSETPPPNPRHWLQYEYPAVVVPDQKVVLKDQFGTETVNVGFPFALMVPALKNDTSPPNVQHWTQYGIDATIDPGPVLVSDQFGTSLIDLSPIPSYFLANSFKNGTGLVGGEDMKCYTIQDETPQVDPLPHTFTDQFGSSIIDPGTADTLCVLAQKTPLTPPVGGEILGIDMTSLLVAGAFANAGWILPVIGVTAAGIVGFVLKMRIKSSKR